MKPHFKCPQCGHSTKDLTGQTFGLLTVVEHVCGSKYHANWRCLCKCGKHCVVLSYHLTRGATKSCGCLRTKRNNITIDGSVAYIELADGRTAIIDAEDVERARQHYWFSRNRRVCTMTKRKYQSLSWFVLGITPDKDNNFVVDHIDSNPCNNQKKNLQLCEQSSNIQKSRFEVGKTGFIGVSHKKAMFRASTEYHGKFIYLGTFATAEEAARAYDKKVLELHGPHARVNFPVGES